MPETKDYSLLTDIIKAIPQDTINDLIKPVYSSGIISPCYKFKNSEKALTFFNKEIFSNYSEQLNPFNNDHDEQIMQTKLTAVLDAVTNLNNAKDNMYKITKHNNIDILYDKNSDKTQKLQRDNTVKLLIVTLGKCLAEFKKSCEDVLNNANKINTNLKTFLSRDNDINTYKLEYEKKCTNQLDDNQKNFLNLLGELITFASNIKKDDLTNNMAIYHDLSTNMTKFRQTQSLSDLYTCVLNPEQFIWNNTKPKIENLGEKLLSTANSKNNNQSSNKVLKISPKPTNKIIKPLSSSTKHTSLDTKTKSTLLNTFDSTHCNSQTTRTVFSKISSEIEQTKSYSETAKVLTSHHNTLRQSLTKEGVSTKDINVVDTNLETIIEELDGNPNSPKDIQTTAKRLSSAITTALDKVSVKLTSDSVTDLLKNLNLAAKYLTHKKNYINNGDYTLLFNNVKKPFLDYLTDKKTNKDRSSFSKSASYFKKYLKLLDKYKVIFDKFCAETNTNKKSKLYNDLNKIVTAFDNLTKETQKLKPKSFRSSGNVPAVAINKVQNALFSLHGALVYFTIKHKPRYI